MTAIHIQGLGTYVPTKRITNVDLMSLVDTNDEWIVSRTGIKARHMLADDENGSDAGTEAALKALEDAGIAAEDITHVLTATCTPDYLCPSTACIISGKIGSHGAMAFDLNAACTGFVYGLDVANSILAGKPGAKVLLVGSEAFTRRLNWEDRTTCILFGDPASGMSGAARTGGSIPCLPSAAGRTATTSPAIRFRTIFTSRCRGVKSSSRLCAASPPSAPNCWRTTG